MPGSIAALRLQNRLFSGGLSSAALQAELADPAQLGAWRQLCTQGLGLSQLLAVPAARTVLQGSSLAADEALRSGRSVGSTLDGLTLMPSDALRDCRSFAQVLSTPAARLALIGSPSALEFVFASPWATSQVLGIFGTALADAATMDATLNTPTLLTAVLGDAAAAAAFRASTALTLATVPQMTSSTAPSGVASASLELSTYKSWNAFDKNTNQPWGAGVGAAPITNQWIGYEFPSPVFVHSVTVNNYAGNPGVKSCIVQCSNDGIAWADVLSTDFTAASNALQTRYIDRPGRFKRWRLFIKDTQGPMTYMYLNELNFIGFQ